MDTTEKKCTFDEMPVLLTRLLERFDSLCHHIRSLRTGGHASDWMGIDQLREYLPGNPARHTVYEWIREQKFPHYNRGKNFFFFRPEVDAWLKEGRCPSRSLRKACGKSNKNS